MSKTRFILNASGWRTVCENAVVADRALRRMRGLLGRSGLATGEGMLLRPAPAIHTAFMRFPIDALFLDNEHRVVEIFEELPPWRTASNRRARTVLELAAGEARRRHVEVGDQLLILDEDPSAPLARDGGKRPSRRRFASVTARWSAANGNGHEAAANTERSRRLILLAATDRRFRTVASALLERHGCRVMTSASPELVADMVLRQRPQIVVLDAGGSLTQVAPVVAHLQSLAPPVGIVLVGDHPNPGLAGLPVLPKWGPFEDLVSALEDAFAGRSFRGSLVERS
jgi:uncharacterized membrane protein (UPF0127 family)